MRCPQSIPKTYTGMTALMSPASAKRCTPRDVILDFRSLDADRNGEISAKEFIDGLARNPQLASKLGLADAVLHRDAESRGGAGAYERAFLSIDRDRSGTVDVMRARSRCPRRECGRLRFAWRSPKRPRLVAGPTREEPTPDQ